MLRILEFRTKETNYFTLYFVENLSIGKMILCAETVIQGNGGFNSKIHLLVVLI